MARYNGNLMIPLITRPNRTTSINARAKAPARRYKANSCPTWTWHSSVLTLRSVRSRWHSFSSSSQPLVSLGRFLLQPGFFGFLRRQVDLQVFDLLFEAIGPDFKIRLSSLTHLFDFVAAQVPLDQVFSQIVRAPLCELQVDFQLFGLVFEVPGVFLPEIDGFLILFKLRTERCVCFRPLVQFSIQVGLIDLQVFSPAFKFVGVLLQLTYPHQQFNLLHACDQLLEDPYPILYGEGIPVFLL
jgi:hypothetical protein